MDFELAVFFLFMGGLMALVFVGIGVIIGRNNIHGNNDGVCEGTSSGNSDSRFCVSDGVGVRTCNNGCFERMDEKTQEIEQLARKLNVKLD